MKEFLIFLPNDVIISMVAKKFVWDNDDNTIVFKDENDSIVAIFRQESIIGVSMKLNTRNEEQKLLPDFNTYVEDQDEC